MATNAQIIKLVEELQHWIDEQVDAAVFLFASATIARDSASISIGGVCIWDDQDHNPHGDEELTLEWLKASFLRELAGLGSLLKLAVEQRARQQS